MNFLGKNDEDDQVAFLPVKVSQNKPTDEIAASSADKGWRSTLRKISAFIRGYTASEMDELKGAGVSIVSGKARVIHAEADAKIAEAIKNVAQANDLDASAEERRLRANTEAYVARKKADIEAAERLLEMMMKIKEKGGDVGFSSSEISFVLGQVSSKTFPEGASHKQSQLAGTTTGEEYDDTEG